VDNTLRAAGSPRPDGRVSRALRPARSKSSPSRSRPAARPTASSLPDVANDRIAACAAQSNGKPPTVGDFFEPNITQEELIGIFARFRVPRHLFKFLYRLLVEHCNRYTSEKPQWKIDRDTLQSSLSLFMRDLETFDKGLGVG
jgi:hypothetical protein